MIKLLKNVECYKPEYMGRQNILLAFDKIVCISPDISVNCLPDIKVFECEGKIACPGFIDQHVHISGGGGEQGPQSIIAPLDAGSLVSAGVTTVVGLLGADAICKSMQGLLMKAYSLEADGLTTFIYSGNYGVPTATITGRLLTDIALIEKIIGAGEIAISDYRSSYPTLQELLKMAYETISGGRLGNKAGVMHIHVGDGKGGLGPIYEILDNSDFPVSMFVPTHLNRNRTIFNKAVQYCFEGGNIDLTAGENTSTGCSVSECLKELLDSNSGLERVTVSSDGNGSGAGQSHMETASVSALFNDIRAAVQEEKIPLETALKTVTTNVAKLLKLYPAKGQLAAGCDADILLLDGTTMKPDLLFAKGRLLVENGRPLV